MGNIEKTLKFLSKKSVDLTNDKGGYTIVRVKKDHFKLLDFKLQEGHDDSLPYTAVVLYNGKPFAKCLNDGLGGTTEITPIDIPSKAVLLSVNRKLAEYKWSYMGVDFPLSLDFIADTLAATEASYLARTIKGRIKTCEK